MWEEEDNVKETNNYLKKEKEKEGDEYLQLENVSLNS